MNTAISHSKLISIARRAFKDVRFLAQTSRPGCVQARAALKKAARFGLGDKPYIVRDSMAYGWTGSPGHFDVEPLFGTREPRGGAREGAGRPAADGASGMSRVNVTLDSGTIAKLRELGGGNLSVGIRVAAHRL